jgi:hypothetical protein
VRGSGANLVPCRGAVIDGASHSDLYDKEQYVGPAVTKLAGFFTSNLAADTAPSTPAAQLAE